MLLIHGYYIKKWSREWSEVILSTNEPISSQTVSEFKDESQQVYNTHGSRLVIKIISNKYSYVIDALSQVTTLMREDPVREREQR